MIGNNYFDFDRLVGGRYSDVIPQFTDAFGVSLSIFGLDPRDIPPLREEQILDFEIEGMFPNQLRRTPDGKRYFEHAGKRLYIQKVHNTTIEKCLGVDLIYNFVDEERAVFIPRITNDQFKELVESGLFGSVPQQTRAISTHLVNESGDERLKLIFTESSHDRIWIEKSS